MLPTQNRALRIGAAVVETVMRGIVGRIGDLAFELAVAVDEPDAVAQCGNEAAAHAQREAADRCGHRPRGIRAGRRVEPVERRRVDVHPIQRLVGNRPHRAFAKAGFDIQHAFERGMTSVGRHDRKTHRTRKARLGREQSRARVLLADGSAIERVGHVRDGFDGDEVAIRGNEYDEVIACGIRTHFDREPALGPADDRRLTASR